MAKATVKYKEEVRPVESVTLTLNHDELLVLTTILNQIGGCPDKSPRKHAASILNAIVTDIDPMSRDHSKVRELIMISYIQQSGSIYFEDYK